MNSLYVTDEGDKFSFIGSHLQSGLCASRLMQASSFPKLQEKKLYFTSHTKFLSSSVKQ